MSDVNSQENNRLASSQYLLKEFENDMYQLYKHLQQVEIAFSNLQGSWVALSCVHKIVKDEIENR